MNRAQIMLLTVLPAGFMFKRDPVTASSTSPDVSSDLALTDMRWMVSKRESHLNQNMKHRLPHMKITVTHHLIIIIMMVKEIQMTALVVRIHLRHQVMEMLL